MRIANVLGVVGILSIVSCAGFEKSLKILDLASKPVGGEVDTRGVGHAPSGRNRPDAANQPDSAKTASKDVSPLRPRCSGFDRVEEWIAEEGSDLESTLRVWAKSVGWTVANRTNYRWPIEASHRFSGDFGKAVDALLESFGNASPAPTARAHCANQVLVLGDRG